MHRYKFAPVSSSTSKDAALSHVLAERDRWARAAKVWNRVGFMLLLLSICCLLTLPMRSNAAVTGSTRFIPTFLVYYGGGPTLTFSDAAKLAKYDLIDIDRYRYMEISGSTWASIKALNPNVEIYLYELGGESLNWSDSLNQVSLNNLGRYNVSRGHPMGSLNGNHPELFLVDGSGNRIYSKAYSNVGANQYAHLMDFGSPAYQSYWVTAVKADIVDQPWKADGIFADMCVTFASSGGYSATSAKYPDNASWSNAMNAFSSGIAGGLHGYGQKLWCNKGDMRSSAGAAAWRALDASANHPDVLLEEGAFAVEWGSAVQFYPESEWKNTVDLLASITNSKVAMMSHTQLAPGQTGTDNWGKPVTFWQAFYYSIGSLLLGKNAQLNNSYLTFSSGTAYDSIVWFDEYDKIDLGTPVGAYSVTNVGGVNVYWREFAQGYVAVNPTANDVLSFSFPQAVKLITHDNVLSQSTIASVSSVALKGHNAAIVLKTSAGTGGGGTGGGTADTTAPSVPTGLGASAASSSQINVKWNASTDNVGVTGYKVYRNGTLFAILGDVLAVQDTGLAAGTQYSYTVQAVDAAGNASAQSGAVTTTTASAPSAADTTAPSAPSGLTSSGVTGTQITLSWKPSTDNVAVTGYRIYVNDAPVATSATTTFTHSGLTANTSYKYRVTAYDAAGNNSASSDTLSVRTKRH